MKTNRHANHDLKATAQNDFTSRPLKPVFSIPLYLDLSLFSLHHQARQGAAVHPRSTLPGSLSLLPALSSPAFQATPTQAPKINATPLRGEGAPRVAPISS